jgi:hypothetical protein
MGKVMKAKDFVNKAIDIANNYKTLYVMGCFGAPMNSKNKKRYTNNHNYNKQASRTKMINNASSDTFGFDCVCLIKGILWGWNGNKNHVYGGANYGSNGVSDMGADSIITSKYCTNISSNFNNIEAGEIVWMSGHVGIYIGNSQVVECTPAWKNKVQITKLSQRKWLKHGKLNYIDYTVEKPVEPTPKPKTKYKEGDVVNINGIFINSTSTKKLNPLIKKGTITKIVLGSRNPYLLNKGLIGWTNDECIVSKVEHKKTIDEIAKEVIAGKWGNGTDRKNRLEKAGYNYKQVQNRVNQLLK